MKNCNSGSAVHPLPCYAEDAMAYIALSVFFLFGVAAGVYLPGKAAIVNAVRAFVLSLLSHSFSAPDLIHTAAGIVIPAVFCTLCAFTTFGALIILPFFSFIGFIAGQALSVAYTLFAADGLISICVPFLIVFTAALACWLLTGAQSICASLGMLKLALGRVPARLPVFDLNFYRRFGRSIIFLLLTAVFFTSTYTRIISAIF